MATTQQLQSALAQVLGNSDLRRQSLAGNGGVSLADVAKTVLNQGQQGPMNSQVPAAPSNNEDVLRRIQQAKQVVEQLAMQGKKNPEAPTTSPAPSVGSAENDLTKYYNQFERQQLNDARAKDFHASLGTVSKQAKDRFENEKKVRAAIDPQVQARLEKTQSNRPDRAAQNAENERKRLEGDKANARDPSLNPQLATLLQVEARNASKDLSDSEIKAMVPDMMEEMRNGKSLDDIRAMAQSKGFDNHIAKLEKLNKVSTIESSLARNKAAVAQATVDMKKDVNKLLNNSSLELPTGTKTAIGKDLVDQVSMMANLTTLANSFKPEYFQRVSQLANKWRAVKDKNFGNLDQQEKAALSEFTKFRQVLGVLKNEKIHELSGGAVTPEEAVRIEEGILTGEVSPTEAAAKIQNILDKTRESYQRNYRALQSGSLPDLSQPSGAVGNPALQSAQGGALADIEARIQELRSKQ